MYTQLLSRFMVYGVLLLAAFFFLAPLYVMLVTSLKDAEQIRSGNLLSLPNSLNFEAWSLAWSSACTGTDCRGLQPFFWNSVIMVVPAVLVSTLWGAMNGYVLSLWKFRGSEVMFGFMLFGVFMPFQVVLFATTTPPFPKSWLTPRASTVRASGASSFASWCRCRPPS